MDLRERIGVDVGTALSVLEAVSWAAENDVHYVDVRLGESLINDIDREEIKTTHEICTGYDVHLDLHTLSAVNIAATEVRSWRSRRVRIVVYSNTGRLATEWIVVHGGCHFTDDREERMEASIARLERMISEAADIGVDLLLENHNPEPPSSEIHYSPITLEECERYFDALSSDRLRWKFTANHALICFRTALTDSSIRSVSSAVKRYG